MRVNRVVTNQVANREIKFSQYADDTTTFCKDELSLGKLLDLLDIYGDCSGLKLNTAKTETLWLGINAARKDTPFGIKWPETPICALGTSFSYNYKLCECENFTPKINKPRACLHGGGGPQVGEVTRLGGVARLSI